MLSSIPVLLRLSSYTYTIMTSGNLHKTINKRLAETFALILGIALSYFSFALSFSSPH
jgi:hypothetical protein